MFEGGEGSRREGSRGNGIPAVDGRGNRNAGRCPSECEGNRNAGWCPSECEGPSASLVVPRFLKHL